MPRRPRGETGGFLFHVMNRGARRLRLFERADDYTAFLRVLREATVRTEMRLLCYVLMPNHWHLVVWPIGDDDLSGCMAWMTATHVRRWHLSRESVGTGTLYQGRYKAVPIKSDAHFLTVCRYVERNPVRAGLVPRACDWPWSSASRADDPAAPRLDAWPIPRPANWDALVNAEQTPQELRELRLAIRHSRPFGPERWQNETANQLGWRTGRRPRGRPSRGVAETENYPDPV